VGWHKGRDAVVAKTTTIDSYSPTISIKTTNGSWEIGAYDHSSYTDKLIFSYVTDANYNNNTNSHVDFTINTEGYFSGSCAASAACTGNAATVSRATFGDANNAEHNANNITSNGLYYYTSNGPSKDSANQFSSTDGAIYCQAYNTTWVAQIAQDYQNGALAVRGKNNGTWSTWYSIPKMIVENYPALLPPNNSNNWIKIGTANDSYGLLPSQAGVAGSGHNYLGTSSWYWKYAYIDQIYGYLNGNISGSSTSCTGNAATATYAVNCKYGDDVIQDNNHVWEIMSNNGVSVFTTGRAAAPLKAGGLVSSYTYSDNAGAGILVLDTSENSNRVQIYFYRKGSAIAGINTDGSTASYSSREKKKNIIPLNSFGEAIDKLKPVSFNYKNDSKAEINYGLIYEDTINVLPYICETNENDILDKTISYEKLIPILLKEIQDLRARVKALEQNKE